MQMSLRARSALVSSNPTNDGDVVSGDAQEELKRQARNLKLAQSIPIPSMFTPANVCSDSLFLL